MLALSQARESARAFISQEIGTLVRLAAMKGDTLNARDEAVRLLGLWPDCGWRFNDLVEIITRDAAGRGVAIEFV